MKHTAANGTHATIRTKLDRNNSEHPQQILREETMKRPQSQVDKTQPQKTELHKQYRAIGPAAIAAALVFSRKRKPIAATTPSLKSGKAA